MNRLQTPTRSVQAGSWKAWLVFAIFAVIAGYLLSTEHRIHVLAVLPWLLVLCCPLMMVFMHHGSTNSDDRGQQR